MASGSVITGPGIVVWEWQDDFGGWIPYDPLSSQEIEKEHVVGTTGSIQLGQSNLALVNYVVDLTTLQQRNIKTGLKRLIQRNILSATSALAYHSWEWDKGTRNHPLWVSYPTNVIEYLEKKYQSNTLRFSLEKKFKMPYRVDLGAYIQENVRTFFKRKIKRITLRHQYPLDLPRIPNNNIPQQLNGITNLSQPFTTYQSSFPGPQVPSSSSQTQNVIIPHQVKSPSSSSSLNIYQGASAGNQKSVVLPPCPQGGIPCTAQGASKSTVPVTDVLKNFTNKFDVDTSSTDQCAICQSPLTEESGFGNSKSTHELKLCKHVFHTECIETSYEHSVKNGCIVCPTCNRMHGIKTGTQPPGVMTYSTLHRSLSGFERHHTLQITYNIPSGIQTSEHPHPGRSYHASGFPRIAYLPDNDQGKSILLLLIEAWKRRLIFMVGQSSTTGLEDCVTWTGIHHKTEMGSQRGHGYPDVTYLDRVTNELEAEGVA